VNELEQFAAERGARLTLADDEIRPFVTAALAAWGQPQWWSPILEAATSLWLEIFLAEAPDVDPATPIAAFRELLGESLSLTEDPTATAAGQIERVTEYVGTTTVNDATYRAARATRALGMRWVSMSDGEVRPAHRAADGQVVSIRGAFVVGGERLRFPGDPRGSLPNIMGCRCILAPIRREAAMTAALTPEKLRALRELEAQRAALLGLAPDALTAAVDEDDDLIEEINDSEDVGDDELLPDEIPWHGVLAPMGIASGDNRMFSVGALSNRDLPLPLKYQALTDDGHRSAEPAARIDSIEYYPEDNPRLAIGRGMILTRHKGAQEMVAGLIDGSERGVSVDVDAVHELPQEFEISDDMEDAEIAEMMQSAVQTFDRARIMGATMVSFPAFPEAYIALGEDFEDGELDMILARLDGDEERLAELVAACIPCQARDEELSAEFRDYTPEERSKMAESGEALPDGSFPIADIEDLRNAIQAIGRASDPEAAKAHIVKRASALGAADLIPEEWAADDEALAAAAVQEDEELVSQLSEQFAPGTRDGPGWLTNPEDAQRIRNYWTRGKGAAKIRWGADGDFNRCRKQLAKYVNPMFLAGTCANLHKVALGFWPGQHRGQNAMVAAGEMAPAFTLVASALLPGEWFSDPLLTGPTSVQVTPDGRIFGHAATWDTCHIGMPGRCVTPPTSDTDYAHFAVGVVETTAGAVHVGQITMDTGHAELRAGPRAAAAHYDNTGVAIADVAVGEDEYGIWIAGAFRANATEDQRDRFRAGAKVSGDWRGIGGNLEMVGLLAVNVPGFPTPRTALAASGEDQFSLVAAGIPEEQDIVTRVADEVESRQRKRERAAAAASAVAPIVGQWRADRVKSALETIGRS